MKGIHSRAMTHALHVASRLEDRGNLVQANARMSFNSMTVDLSDRTFHDVSGGVFSSARSCSRSVLPMQDAPPEDLEVIRGDNFSRFALLSGSDAQRTGAATPATPMPPAAEEGSPAAQTRL